MEMVPRAQLHVGDSAGLGGSEYAYSRLDGASISCAALFEYLEDAASLDHEGWARAGAEFY